MAGPKNDDKDDLAPAQAARAAAKDVTPSSDDETYSRDWLIEAAGYLGFLPHEVAGALSAIPKKNLTIEEARAATKTWLDTPIEEA